LGALDSFLHHRDTESTERKMSSGSVVEDRIYTCEVRFKKKLSDGQYEWDWKTKPVKEVIAAEDTVYRCKDCHGAVKVFRKHKPHAAAPHVEHIYRADSEYCVAGMYFREAKDGRTPRLSRNPVK
jgi:hypothetical protein